MEGGKTLAAASQELSYWWLRLRLKSVTARKKLWVKLQPVRRVSHHIYLYHVHN